MKEQIYTVPVNKVNDTDSECPLCELEKKLEKEYGKKAEEEEHHGEL